MRAPRNYPPSIATVVLRPADLAEARRKLKAVYGIQLSGRHGTATLARCVARVLMLPEPDGILAQGSMISAFVAGRRGVAEGLAVRPFVPLKVGDGMLRALARAAEWDRYPRSSGR